MLLKIAVNASTFGVDQVEEVYRSIKTSGILLSTLSLVTVLALYLMIRKILNEYRKAQYENGRVDMKHVTGLIYHYAAFAFVITALPFLITGIEAVLADMQALLLRKLSSEPQDYKQMMLAEIDGMTTRFPKSPSLFSNIINTFDYITAIYLKPFLAWFIRYLYSMVISGRYLYLLLLEIAAPIAIIMLLNKEQHHHFWAWAKHMFACYLMIPAFILANAFCDKVVIATYEDPYSFMCLVAQLLLKIYLFKKVSQYVFKLI